MVAPAALNEHRGALQPLTLRTRPVPRALYPARRHIKYPVGRPFPPQQAAKQAIAQFEPFCATLAQRQLT